MKLFKRAPVEPQNQDSTVTLDTPSLDSIDDPVVNKPIRIHVGEMAKVESFEIVYGHGHVWQFDGTIQDIVQSLDYGELSVTPGNMNLIKHHAEVTITIRVMERKEVSAKEVSALEVSRFENEIYDNSAPPLPMEEQERISDAVRCRFCGTLFADNETHCTGCNAAH